VIRPLLPLPKNHNDDQPAIRARFEGRPLRVMIDRHTTLNGDALDVLDALSMLPQIELWATTDEGGRWLEIDWGVEHNDHIAVRLHSPSHSALSTTGTQTDLNTFCVGDVVAQHRRARGLVAIPVTVRIWRWVAPPGPPSRRIDRKQRQFCWPGANL
jgi:hypothetical protein